MPKAYTDFSLCLQEVSSKCLSLLMVSADSQPNTYPDRMWQNQIIGGIAPETKVFRVFPISRLESVLETKQLTLVIPSKWDDPFENQLYNIKVIDGLTQAGRATFYL